jgi:mannose-1-phosphate guanylyltransferase
VQPFNRETAPGLLYPLLHISRHDPDAIVCILPSDHFILEEELFMEYVSNACSFVAASSSSTVLLGVEPQQPDGEYGWIETGSRIPRGDGTDYFEVGGFSEKPDSAAAGRLYSRGGLVNTFVLISKASNLLNLFRLFTPALYDTFMGVRHALGSSSEEEAVEKAYLSVPSINFSHEILGKNPEGLRVLRVKNVYWSDWGDPSRILADLGRHGALRTIGRPVLPQQVHSPVQAAVAAEPIGEYQ